jgi:hypothetical protein
VVRNILFLKPVEACGRRDGGLSTPFKSKVLLKVLTMTITLCKTDFRLGSHQVTVKEGTVKHQIRLAHLTAFFGLVMSLRVYLLWPMTWSELK